MRTVFILQQLPQAAAQGRAFWVSGNHLPASDILQICIFPFALFPFFLLTFNLNRIGIEICLCFNTVANQKKLLCDNGSGTYNYVQTYTSNWLQGTARRAWSDRWWSHGDGCSYSSTHARRRSTTQQNRSVCFLDSRLPTRKRDAQREAATLRIGEIRVLEISVDNLTYIKLLFTRTMRWWGGALCAQLKWWFVR